MSAGCNAEMLRFTKLQDMPFFAPRQPDEPTGFYAAATNVSPACPATGGRTPRILPTDGADKVISEWQDTLPEGSERMNVHTWRSALLLAWLRHEEAISTKTAEDAVRVGQYQVDSHDYYRTKAADTANARVQGKIMRALTMRGPLPKRQLQQITHAQRDGTDLWGRALDGLIKDRAVGKREDGT